MADTLIREAIAYGSQPFSPVPQYWDGSSYVKVQGINGAIRVINYNSTGETFTGASPGSVQMTATSTVVISGTSTIDVSGAITVEFSATGTVEILSSAGGTAYFSSTNPGIIGNKVVGSHANAWSASATVTAGATSNAIDCQYTYNLSIFGTVDTTAIITIQISQDDATYYTHSANITMTGSGTYHRLFDNAARYTRLAIDTTATITATIAGK